MIIYQTLFTKNLFSYTNNDLLVKFTKLILPNFSTPTFVIYGTLLSLQKMHVLKTLFPYIGTFMH